MQRFKMIVGAFVLTLALPVVAQTEPQFPTCFRSLSNPPAAGESPVYLYVDAYGNFYTLGIVIDGPGFRSSVSYIADSALDGLCKSGAIIGAISRDAVFNFTPKPYLTVVEFREDKSQIHFLAARGADADYIVGGNVGTSWRVTGLSFKLPRRAPDLAPVHVFFGNFGNNLPSHLYTADTAEFERRQQEIASGRATYVYERIAFYAPRAMRETNGTFTCGSPQLTPAYRLYKRASFDTEASRYRYVSDAEYVRALDPLGWINEGASFCVMRD